MNSNWKTPEEMTGKYCEWGDGGILTKSSCAECSVWLWRPCDACDTGTVITRDGDKLVHTPCQVCNGTGHDGSGKGRCGLINM